jgi:hypothetical protein
VNGWIRRLLVAASMIGLLGAAQIEQVGRTRGAIWLPEGTPSGSVILIPGGTNLQTIRADGGTDAGQNFVMRVRFRFVAAGFAILYLNDPLDLRPAIARMRRIARPVFLVGTSSGSIVAARNAANLGADGPDGIVLTSSITKASQSSFSTMHDVNVRRIAVPVLFVHNMHDNCPYSPPGGIPSLAARFAKPAEVTQITVSSDGSDGEECGPISPHGFLGIENAVADEIITWMQAHAEKAPGP